MSLTFEDDKMIEAEPGLAQKYPEYMNLINTINSSHLELPNWDKLFTYLDHLVEIDQSLMLKQALHDHYNSLLLQFPYLVDYWKNFITMEYQLQGLSKSVKVIQKSLDLFPNSIDLWLDYLNIIISNNLDNGNDSFVRNLFIKSLDLCGRQFLSHPLWDKFLEWESSKSGQNSVEYIGILLKVIELPLHQYAKYSTEFLELKNNFPLTELIPPDVLDGLLNERSLDTLTVDEQVQISDDFFSKIITRTSQRTNKRWDFEQNIKTTQFQIAAMPSEELINWENYLSFEESQGDHKQIVSLYERCLIVCCMYEKFWIKYLKYLIKIDETDQEIRQIFTKSLRHVPRELINLKIMYARYLLNKDLDKSFNLLISTMGDLVNEEKSLPILFLILIKDENYQTDAQIFLKYSFGDYSETTADEPLLKKRRTDVLKNIEEIRQQLLQEITGEYFKQTLQKITSFNNLNSIILNHTISEITDIKQKRDLYLRFINKSLIARDVQFLSSFVNFEIQQQNIKNLNNILTYLLNYSQLERPIQHILISQILNFLFKNTDPSTNKSELVKILLEIDENSSFNYKKFSKTRNQINDQMLIRQLGHPGIDTDARPIIVSRLNFFEILKTVPALPVYKNVEKLSSAIKYPKTEEENL